jgi:hypothetical protein
MTMPIPWLRYHPRDSPITRPPGRFISTIAETRSAVPSHDTGRRDRIAIECEHPKDMSGQREAADFRRARIEHVEQHTLAFLDPYEFASAEHSPVDAERVVAALGGNAPPTWSQSFTRSIRLAAARIASRW